MSEPVKLPGDAMASWILTPAKVGPARAAKHRLVDAVRLLNEAVTVLDITALDPSAIDALTDDVAAATDAVTALPAFAAGPGEAGAEDARLLERSGFSGAGNPMAAPMALARDGDRVVGHATYGYRYEGPPGAVHGGFVAAAFDDLLGAAQTLSGTAGYTGTLTIKMISPHPLNERIDYEGGVTSLEGRKILTWGRSSHAGRVLAEAEGLFITPRWGSPSQREA